MCQVSSLSTAVLFPCFHTHILCQWLRGNTSVGTGLIEFTDPSDTSNNKPFFKHCILQTILYKFLLFIFMKNKIDFWRNWTVFYICLVWFGVAFCVTILQVLCFWYRSCVSGALCVRCWEYNLLGIAIKKTSRNVCRFIFLTICNILHRKNSKYMIYNINYRCNVSFCMRVCKNIIKK